MREQNQQQPPADGDNESDLNSKLKKRLWIAGGLVAVALAAIPLMDALTKPKMDMSSDAQSPSSGKIVKPAASSPSAGAIALPKAASAAAEQSSAPAAEPANRAPATPAETSPASPDLSKTPAVANQQASRHAGAPHPAAQNKPAAPEKTPPAATARQPAPPTRNAAAAPQPAAQQEAPPAKIAAEAPAKAQPAGSSVGYQVQLGLFASMGNAQKLVKDLQKHGIAAHTVTRVQLGPFKTRAEADDAMSKLRSLGYSPLLAAEGQ
ncbi:SPOR domain-containing protein [Chromobacterium subtsugae]|uniref:SPOR domain-containing protein n=1 Tax=Chromobacterium subtsugae TaxID=251747 RepID=UPI000640F222|nr:SPOR domain-containing protein [Chromobacterium subtsugae]